MKLAGIALSPFVSIGVALFAALGVRGEWQAGLLGGRLSGDALKIGTYPSSTSVTLRPEAGLSKWSGNYCYVYTGQMRFDSAGTYWFAESTDDCGYAAVCIGGVWQEVLNDNRYNMPTCGSFDIPAAGWYDVEFRVANTGGGGAIAKNPGWTAEKGLGWKAGGGESVDGNDYEIPADPGDMSLFRCPDGRGFSDALTVTAEIQTGAAREYGSPTPGLGIHHDLAVGDTFTCSIPDEEVSVEGEKAEPVGYRLDYLDVDTMKATNSVSGAELSLTYVHRCCARLTWLFRAKCTVTVASDPAEGTVTADKAWYDAGETAVLTAVPQPGFALASVSGQLAMLTEGKTSVSVPVGGPLGLTAVFQPARYVAVNGSDAADGLTAATPYATVQKAVDELIAMIVAGTATRGIVSVAAGTYESATTIATITNAVAVVGAGIDRTVFRVTAPKVCVTKLNNARAVLADVTLTGASGAVSGGASYIDAGLIRRCRITGNASTSGGTGYSASGFVRMPGANAHAEYCTFDHNTNSSTYCAIYTDCGTISNCLVFANRSAGIAGITVRAHAKVRNCTVTGNHSSGNKVGFCANSYSATALFENNVISGNEAPNAAAGAEIEIQLDNASSSNSFSNCLTPVPVNEKCLAGNPVFVDPSSHDYRLGAGSPCRDAGVTYPVDRVLLDLDGVSRLRGEAVDIGCYEADPDAFALAFSVEPDSLFAGEQTTLAALVEGAKAEDFTYSWTVTDATGRYTNTTSGACVSLRIDRVGRYSVELTATDKDDPTRRVSVSRAGCVSVRAKDLYAVPYANPDAAWPYADWDTAGDIFDVLDAAEAGATIHLTNGEYVVSDTLQVTKAVTIRGAGRDEGPDGTVVRYDRTNGGIRVMRVNHPNAVVEDMAFTGGNSQIDGPGYGVYVDTLGGTIRRCRVFGCATTMYSHGALALNSAAGYAESCVVTDNQYTASYQCYGGGLVLWGGAVAENCLVADNRGLDGGGVGINNGILRNSTVVGNRAGHSAGGIFFGYKNSFSAASRIENCIVFGNTEPDSRKESVGYPVWSTSVADLSVVTNAVSHCCFGGVWPLGDTMIDGDPMFKDAAKGDYHLKRRSPCRDAGLGAAWMDTATDLDGRPRVKHVTPWGERLVDIGCYESVWRPDGLMLLVR